MPTTLRGEVEAVYGMSLGASTKVAGMGDECDIWRVDTSRGMIALRVSPAWRTNTRLSWSHRLLAFVATRVPEAVAPWAGTAGNTLIEWEGRPASVYPWAEGAPAALDTPHLSDLAGRLLARLHKAMLGWTDPAAPPGPTWPRPEQQRTELVDPGLEQTLSEIDRSSELARGPIHGDYYPRNLICREGRIVGVIDWDDSHEDLLAQELAWAVWEFAQHPLDAALRVDVARNFLAAYADEGGPVPAGEHRFIIPLLRKRLRDEINQALAAVSGGEAIDWEYTNREIEAFQRLRGLDIEW